MSVSRRFLETSNNFVILSEAKDLCNFRHTRLHPCSASLKMKSQQREEA